VEHLDGDETFVSNVVRQVDRSGSTATDLALQDVTSREGFMEQWRYVEHGYPVVSDRS